MPNTGAILQVLCFSRSFTKPWKPKGSGVLWGGQVSIVFSLWMTRTGSSFPVIFSSCHCIADKGVLIVIILMEFFQRRERTSSLVFFSWSCAVWNSITRNSKWAWLCNYRRTLYQFNDWFHFAHRLVIYDALFQPPYRVFGVEFCVYAFF